MLSEGPPADLGLWAITNMGIKIFNAHLYNSENNKKLNVDQRVLFSGPPVPPKMDIYAVRGTGPPGLPGFSSPEPQRPHLAIFRTHGRKGATPVPNVQQGAFRRNLRTFWQTAPSMNELMVPRMTK